MGRLRLAPALATIGLAAACAGGGPRADLAARAPDAPRVEAWLDEAGLHFALDAPAYVAILERLDDVRVRVLFPATPADARLPRDSGLAVFDGEIAAPTSLFVLASAHPLDTAVLFDRPHRIFQIPEGSRGRLVRQRDEVAAVGALLVTRAGEGRWRVEGVRLPAAVVRGVGPVRPEPGPRPGATTPTLGDCAAGRGSGAGGCPVRTPTAGGQGGGSGTAPPPRRER